jgi:hypothetical protein
VRTKVQKKKQKRVKRFCRPFNRKHNLPTKVRLWLRVLRKRLVLARLANAIPVLLINIPILFAQRNKQLVRSEAVRDDSSPPPAQPDSTVSGPPSTILFASLHLKLIRSFNYGYFQIKAESDCKSSLEKLESKFEAQNSKGNGLLSNLFKKKQFN